MGLMYPSTQMTNDPGLPPRQAFTTYVSINLMEGK